MRKLGKKTDKKQEEIPAWLIKLTKAIREAMNECDDIVNLVGALETNKYHILRRADRVSDIKKAINKLTGGDNQYE